MKFLQAEWRKLLIINYAIDDHHLKKYLPFKTELDLWNNTCYISLVGFMFLNTRVLGIKIPFHVNFEEVNLRFYVKHNSGHDVRRGVVFIKEIVPKRALTFTANTLYGENYVTLPMKHNWQVTNDEIRIAYTWNKNRMNSISAVAVNKPQPITNGSEAEFITMHFWGYTKLNEMKTGEYHVEHPSWLCYPVNNYKINVDFEDVYGSEFSFLGGMQPASVYMAEGSPVSVGFRKIIR